MADKNAGTIIGSKRRIMRALKIHEISGVDVPAQEGATAVIMKRKGSKDYDPKNPDPNKRGRASDTPKTDEAEALAKGSALTSIEQSHVHLMVLNGPPDGVELSSGITSFEDNHSHPWVRTEGGTIIIGASKGSDGQPHIHTIAVFSKSDEDDEDDNPSAGNTGKVGLEGEEAMTDETKKAEEAQAAKFADLEKQLGRANSVAALNGTEKSHFDTLADEAAQDSFLARSADERKLDIDGLAKAQTDADPVVYTTTDGIELRKSVGDAFISVAKSNDELRKELRKSNEKNDQVALEKRAETDLAHLPGTVEDRAAMLKAIDGIEDDSQRDAALNALKAQNTAMSKAFEESGVSTTPAPGSPEDTLDGLAKSHKEAHPELTDAQAYDAVLKTEAGGQLYAKSIN